jgi:hypothetical protein
VDQIQKVKVRVRPDRPPSFVSTEIPLIEQVSHSQLLEIPDGGTGLIIVHYRPKALLEKNRWWVLAVAARIVIQEEQELWRGMVLEEALPKLVADILQNPRLKTTRDYYGTPGDKHFALVNSTAWSWPAKFDSKVAEFQQIAARQDGQRVLGIRIDSYQEANQTNTNPMVTATLFNAGGTANGEVIGGCTLRYTMRQNNDTWSVELTK